MSNFVRILIAAAVAIGWCFFFVPWSGLTGFPNMLLSAMVGALLMNWIVWSWK
jgi:hypothetical protein